MAFYSKHKKIRSLQGIFHLVCSEIPMLYLLSLSLGKSWCILLLLAAVEFDFYNTYILSEIFYDIKILLLNILELEYTLSYSSTVYEWQ